MHKRWEIRQYGTALTDFLEWVRSDAALEAETYVYLQKLEAEGRGGPGWLDKMCSFLSGASRCSTYAAVRRVGRLSKYTPSGVWPSSA
jgi:hypothetical protein